MTIAALDRWRHRVHIAPLLPTATAGHSIHSYFNTNPESPDGRHVLFYRSTAADADGGEICVIERASGTVRVLAQVVQIEDAHRAACQQWSDNGRCVTFHDRRDGRWQVLAVDLTGGPERMLAQDRQLGFGCPRDRRVPLYGCHWNPGVHRDLEMVDVRTGEIGIAASIGAVVATYRDWVQHEFGGEDGLSVFFPVVSPDGSRVFFKIAKGRGGDDFRGMDASHRQGKVVWDLVAGQPLRLFTTWGHPSWAPDGSAIFEKGNVLTRIADGSESRPAPGSPSDHPSISPDGQLFVTDCNLTNKPGGHAGEWCLAVGSMHGPDCIIVHRFASNGGATSWRRCHPHPVFSADGRRLYFNVSDGPWTSLHVAEIEPQV